ncbi:MAG: SMP-30/gluconolactonase/LRE family protein [Anaerolineae bacterium]|nr:SMP-30/gluconolactonase/LRE family protein [Anaerolineae bacterium]
MYAIETVFELQNELGEGPLWNPVENMLYWVDIMGKRFFRHTPGTANYEAFDLDTQPGCLAFIEGGGLALGVTEGFAIWREGKLTYLENEAYQPAGRFNDGAVDRAGRFWAGTMSREPENYLFRLDADGSAQVMQDKVITSNGIGWSPDNKTMYYSDSGGGGIVYAYDFDLASGTISNRRTFLPPTGTAAKADGLTVDAEGTLWVAFWNGWRVARYDPDGVLMAEIKMPVQRPTSCMFGGADLSVLYITSASIDMDRTEQPLAGALFSIQTDTKGLPEPFFKLNAAVSD